MYSQTTLNLYRFSDQYGVSLLSVPVNVPSRNNVPAETSFLNRAFGCTPEVIGTVTLLYVVVIVATSITPIVKYTDKKLSEWFDISRNFY